ADSLTRLVVERVQADGICFAGGARWRGRWVIRLSVIAAAMTGADADRSVDALLDAWRAIRSARLRVI
ncbi:hypothetical protein, partial [Escherichia coli]|uniref:hypothetical protein n=1 Tax=Escherichia coli TaxID=562 RepID=UPI001797C4A8